MIQSERAARLDEARRARQSAQETLRAITERIAHLERAPLASVPHSAPGEPPAPPIARVSAFRMRVEPDELLGTWSIGIMARAAVELPQPSGGSIIVPIDSPGLWNIEGDADDEYRAQVYADELATLCDMLAQLGVQIIDDAP